jgi:hypothetical protein
MGVTEAVMQAAAAASHHQGETREVQGKTCAEPGRCVSHHTSGPISPGVQLN